MKRRSCQCKLNAKKEGKAVGDGWQFLGLRESMIRDALCRKSRRCTKETRFLWYISYLLKLEMLKLEDLYSLEQNFCPGIAINWQQADSLAEVIRADDINNFFGVQGAI